MPPSLSRRVIWNFFRLENEHLNNCGNFRAVRDIYITPIRKEKNTGTSRKMRFDTHKVPAAFASMFTGHPKTNGNNTSDNVVEDGSNDHEANGGDGSPAGVAVGAGREDAKMGTSQLPGLIDYATCLRSDRQRSLWQYLRAAYVQTKKERRRRQGRDVIAGMEDALRAARENRQQFNPPTNPRPSLRDTAGPAVENVRTDAPLKEHAVASNTDETATRHVLVNGYQRKAFPSATIPLTVCFLEPPASDRPRSRAANDSEARRLRVSVSGPLELADLPVLPAEAPCLLLPKKSAPRGSLGTFMTHGNRGLDLVIAPEMLVCFRYALDR